MKKPDGYIVAMKEKLEWSLKGLRDDGQDVSGVTEGFTMYVTEIGVDEEDGELIETAASSEPDHALMFASKQLAKLVAKACNYEHLESVTVIPITKE